ncbi:MAG TPA: histidine kinase dimerization/phospho-acceptor domain-containing protein, partial [Sphingomicrobium sp.]|nr:histidine kinase dimerization/phospho-acceptor domain-containing protein [Sphingomicrobium sp.]
LFASDILEVAAPLLAGATLDEGSRREVAANASDEVRRFFFALEGTAAASQKASVEPAAAFDEDIPSIEEAVARIEQFTRDRAQESPGSDPAPPPAQDDEPLELTEPMPELESRNVQKPALFRWESDSRGLIAWVEGAPRGALIGRALAGHGSEALLAEESRDIVARRAPFADVPLASADPFGGEWRVSGAPAFAPGDGRFIGYRGLARRVDLTPSQRAGAPRAFEGADTLRELIHEIKTPLNAIVGFAEIIDGQYLGPAHRRYRQRAGEILEQARLLLAAIDDLDFAAKLRSGRSRQDGESNLSSIAGRLIDANGDAGGDGMITLKVRGRQLRCSLDPALAERLLQRFVDAVTASAPGERLILELGTAQGRCSASLTRPAIFQGFGSEQLFDTQSVEGGPGVGFALRLVRGLARIAGGDVRVEPQSIVLLLPSRR